VRLLGLTLSALDQPGFEDSAQLCLEL